MNDEELIKMLKEEVPVELLTEQERNYIKGYKNTVYAIKYINDIIGDGLKIAKIYYDLYIKD